MTTARKSSASGKSSDVVRGAISSLGSKVSLSSHDINVISVVAQKPQASREEILKVVKDHKVSKDALDIVIMILDGKDFDASGVKRIAKKRLIADNYKSWVLGMGEKSKQKG